MSGNSFGQVFRLTTFGESHGPALGGVVDGCPSDVPLDEDVIQNELDRRKPGSGPASTTRKEDDRIQLLSGVFEGRTTGTAIGFTIANQDQRSKDYEKMRHVFRPGHADFTYQAKYGRRDHRGGGRASGRETACRVAGGAIAQAWLSLLGIEVAACTVELGGIRAPSLDMANALSRPFFAACDDVAPRWEERVLQVKKAGDSLGGLVRVEARGVPAGLGEPVFDKLDARLAYALMGVGAVKAVEIGSGVRAASMLGSEHNDPLPAPGSLEERDTNAGGILGGVSTGQTLIVHAAVKPIPTLGMKQRTIDSSGRPVDLAPGGRHDISAIPRIVPVLKAMVQLVLADFVLLQKRHELF
jgi:chorismate synthase